MAPPLAGCGSQQAATATAYQSASGPSGLDAVIDISHNVTVTDFDAVRRSGQLAVIHKATEGGDWVDPSYGVRQKQAQQAGLLWGAYHFGTRQYSGSDQALAFLATVRPTITTLIALDLELNDGNPRNTMTLAQAEAFVATIQEKTGRLPVLYTHPEWADGRKLGRRGVSLGQPIQSGSLLARCDLWLADYRESPQIPSAWAGRGWTLWQYAGNHTEADVAYGSDRKAVSGVTHCDRNLYAGDVSSLKRYWARGGRA
ncbi:glycoside hydrolase family 25 protein [Reyranella sp.]|uniref:glycoside hydrolase family 25 protein n=1 Tax=Reyranella sp. TaxID=1929291 RepID=UPI003BA84BFE